MLVPCQKIKDVKWPPCSGTLKLAYQEINILKHIPLIEFVKGHLNTALKSFRSVKLTATHPHY